MRILKGLAVVICVLQPSLSWGTDPPQAPSSPPLGPCALFLMKSADYFRSLSRSTVAKIDQAITPVAPWNISSEDEATISAVFSNPELSEEERFEQAYRLLVGARIRQFNPISRYFVRGAVEDSIEQNSLYAKTLGMRLRKYLGPHYNPVFNRTSTFVRPSTGLTPLDSILAIHETEHYLHRNTNPIFWLAAAKVATIETLSVVVRTPLIAIFRRRQEVRAIGAQWELARLIPADIRANLLRDWRYERSYVSHFERLWVRALMKSGILDRMVALMERGLDLESTGFDSEMSRQRLAETLVAKIVAGQNITNWYKPFYERARPRLTNTELAYIEGVANDGSGYEPLRREMHSYFDAHSEQEILSDDGLNLELARALQTSLSDAKYSDKFSEAVDQIYGATLEYAALPKNEFIERLSLLQGYTLENINYHHYNTPTRNYMLLVSYGAVLTSMAGIVPSAAIPSPDIHALFKYLAYLIGP